MGIGERGIDMMVRRLKTLGVQNLKGSYPAVNIHNITTDMIYRRFFDSMLEGTRADADRARDLSVVAAIDTLRAQIAENNKIGEQVFSPALLDKHKLIVPQMGKPSFYVKGNLKLVMAPEGRTMDVPLLEIDDPLKLAKELWLYIQRLNNSTPEQIKVTMGTVKSRRGHVIFGQVEVPVVEPIEQSKAKRSDHE